MKYLRVPLALCWILHVLHVRSVTVYPPNRGGGSDGVNGNEFLEGTADTPKLEISTHCSRATPSSTVVTLVISVYQKDIAFKYSNVGPDNDKFVEYETCFLIDTQEYINNKDVEKATNLLSDCGGSASLSKVDAANAMDTGFETRTFTTEVTINPVFNTYGCGGYKVSDDKAIFALTCKRSEDYDKAFDDVFVVYYNDGECVARQMDASFDAREPPTVEHKREFEVTFKAYRNLDLAAVPWPDGPQSVDGAHSNNIREITTDIVKLGESIYFEICLINAAQSTDSPYNQFFPDGLGPIGIFVERCTAVNDANAGTAGINPDTPVTIIEDGCGTGRDPTEMIGKSATSTGRGFMYVKDTTDSTKDWLRNPNCFRSLPTPAVSFARESGSEEAVTLYQCKLEYCFSSDDARCFGDKTKDRDGYPTCDRKRRETTQNTSFIATDYPDKVALAVRVALPEFDPSEEEACHDTTVLISLSTVLSVVLLMVIIIAGLMTYNLRSLAHSYDESTSSMIGIVNKGLYH